MYYRRKVLLSVLEAFGGELGRTDLQKLLFLYTREQKEPAYDFIPHRFGCFSLQAAYDQGALIHHGQLEDTEKWQRRSEAKSYVSELSREDRNALIRLRDDYSEVSGRELLAHVYRQYPYYATRSEVAEEVLNSEELNEVKATRPQFDGTELFTIGYEGKTIEEYLNQLIEADVRLLCDVRKNAMSRKFGFNRRQIESATDRVGIAYRHVPELGIASGKRKAAESEEARERLFDTYEKKILSEKTGEVEIIFDLLTQHQRVALTCFERRPEECHRSRVADALADLPQWEHKITHMM